MSHRGSRPSFPDDGGVETFARAVGVTLREAATFAATESHLQGEAERLKRALVQTGGLRRRHRVTRLKAMGYAAAGLAAAAGIAFYFRGLALPSGQAPLRAEVGSGMQFVQVSENHVSASEAVPSYLRFSDGSKVTVAPYSRVRLAELGPKGAALLLEKGHAEVDVVHRDATTKWSVAAGPFAVAVTGTRFDVAWTPATEQLCVSLYEGQVEIAGPKYASSVTLKAGQRFEASATENGFRVTPLGAAEKVEVNSSPRQSGEAEVSDSTRGASSGPSGLPLTHQLDVSKQKLSTRAQSTASTTPNNGRKWASLVASGKFREVTREADAMGLMDCMSQCSSTDLRALADAARYIGRFDTAEAALRALHDKHPTQSTTASYLLGVVDESRGRNASALRWYDEYLSRSSGGGFTAEARAARLRMLVAIGDKSAARRAATEYLERYPSGSAAGLSRKVLEGR